MTTARTAKEGYEIIEKIKDRSINPGGNGIEFVGASGTGKTSLFFNFVEDFAKNEDELMFWRESLDTPIQFIKYPRFSIFVEEGMDVEILDQNNGGETVDFPMKNFEEIPKISYKIEKDNQADPEDVKENEHKKRIQNEIFESICDEAKPKELNVIFFQRLSTWVDFIRYLKEIPSWHDVFIDEYEDIFPFNNSGDKWHMIEWATQNLKQIRKGLVNVFVNTQSKSDVSWRIRKKMTIWGYMSGGVPDDDSPVQADAVRSLSVGEAYLDWKRSKFGKINFKPRHADDEVFYVARRKDQFDERKNMDEVSLPNSEKNAIEQGGI